MLFWVLACVRATPIHLTGDTVEVSFLSDQSPTLAPGASLDIAVQPLDGNGSGLSPVAMFFAASDEALQLDGASLVFVTAEPGEFDGSSYSSVAATSLTVSGDAEPGSYRVWVGQSGPSWDQEEGAFGAFDITVATETSDEETQ